MQYGELKELWKKSNKRYICLFGAGRIGCTWAYDLLKAMGFQIDFYCDNNKEESRVIRDGVRIISLQTLYSLKNDILVFITVGDKHQHSIRKQLENNGIYSIVEMSYLFLQTFIESLLEINNQELNEQFRCVLNDEEYISRQFKYCIGYRPDLKNPKTFNEKLQWLKLYDHKDEYTLMADKYFVKQIVGERIGKEYINSTLGVWESFEDIDFDKLPGRFVLKCTHDSGSVVVCKNKEYFDKNAVGHVLRTKLSFNYYWAGREWPYKNINKRIIAEKYLENQNGEGIIDYKFLCANGKVQYIFTCSERNAEKGLRVNFYKKDWTPLPFERHYHKREKEIEKPRQLEEMISLAEKLAAGIRFVRVDFFVVNDRVYFSEFTFYPGGGLEEFTPADWDIEFGKMIEI